MLSWWGSPRQQVTEWDRVGSKTGVLLCRQHARDSNHPYQTEARRPPMAERLTSAQPVAETGAPLFRGATQIKGQESPLGLFHTTLEWAVAF